MVLVNEAYEVLSDPGRRVEYDQALARAWATAEERARPQGQESAPPRREAPQGGGQREAEYGPLYRQWQAHQDRGRRARRTTSQPLSVDFNRAFVVTLLVAGLGWLWLGNDTRREGALGVLLFLLLTPAYWAAVVWVAAAVGTAWEGVSNWAGARITTSPEH